MSSSVPKKWTIACDFDGVINTHVTPFVNAHTIPDPPMPGAFEWLTEMVERFHVIIHSARFTPRGTTEEDLASSKLALENTKIWFRAHGFPEKTLSRFEFWMSHGKPTALIYLDDRAVRFEGSFPSTNDIHQKLKPWKVAPMNNGI